MKLLSVNTGQPSPSSGGDVKVTAIDKRCAFGNRAARLENVGQAPPQ